jgi:hypothetical protein
MQHREVEQPPARLAEQENEVDELKSANRGLFIESNERYQSLLQAQAAIAEHNKACYGHGKIKADLSHLHDHDKEHTDNIWRAC